MIKSIFSVLVLLNHFYAFSQRAEIIQQSSFKHEYAVGYSYYVEDNIDTSKLFFMGVVKTISSQKNEFLGDAVGLLNSKTKQLNGNAYKLKTFSFQDTTLTLTFDVYFASEKHIALMKKSGIKERIVLFDDTKDSTNRMLVVNKTPYYFPKNKRVEVLAHDEDVNLKLQNDSAFKGVTESIRSSKKAIFLTITRKDLVKVIAIGGAVGGSVGGVVGSLVGVVIAKEIAEGYPRNNSDNEIFNQLNYNTGRILMNLYPLHQQIKTH
jgi:hypothetical protein